MAQFAARCILYLSQCVPLEKAENVFHTLVLNETQIYKTNYMTNPKNTHFCSHLFRIANASPYPFCHRQKDEILSLKDSASFFFNLKDWRPSCGKLYVKEATDNLSFTIWRRRVNPSIIQFLSRCSIT